MQTYTEHEVPSVRDRGRGDGLVTSRASANWGAPYFSKGMGGSQLLPSLPDQPPPPPKFHISRNLQGADAGSRGPQSPGSCRLVQAGTVGDGGRGEGGKGCRGAKGGWGGLFADPAAPPGRSPPPRPRSQVLQAPQGVHTELLRFMRLRKVDRLCRPVDTELMAERCAPLQRQRCEGVSL